MKEQSMHTDAHRYSRWPRLSAIALRWKLYRWFKIWRGIIRTHLFGGRYSTFIDRDWWNDYYETANIDDAHTVEPEKGLYPTLVHYNGVENIILSHLFNNGITVSGSSVLDIGSGAGHWIDFYSKLGAARVHGVDGG